MDTERKTIDFYQDRTIGQRFSAASDFVRQNWKILAKNILYIGIPLALLMGYFMQEYLSTALTGTMNKNSEFKFLIDYSLVMIFSGLMGLFLYSMTGALLYKYTKGELRDETGWNDVKGDMFSIMGKVFIQGLIFGLIITVFSFIAGMMIYGISISQNGLFTGIIAIIIVLLVLGLILFLTPSLCLMIFPIFFEKASAWEAIKKGFRLGVKNWGAVFLTMLLGGMIAGSIYYILSMPYFIYVIITEGTGGIIGIILSCFSSIILVITQPLFLIFFAFQYTAIVEKEEGISLQGKLEDFDQL